MSKGIVWFAVMLLLVLAATAYAAPIPGRPGGSPVPGGDWWNNQQQKNQQQEKQNLERYVFVVFSDKYTATCSMLQTYADVTNKLEETRKTNTESLKFNQDLAKEVAKLQAALKAKKAEALRNPSDDLKASIQQLEQQIKDLKATEKTYLTWDWPPKHFSNPQDAQQYIDALTKHLQDLKAKADAEKAKASGTK